MTLNEAFSIINSRKGVGARRVHYLASGFESLHLIAFLRARLFEVLPGCDVEVLQGVYGDLYGNLERAAGSDATATAMVLEWSDLDPRLGLRSTGGWSPQTKADILVFVRERCGRLATAVEKLAARMPVAVAPPSLPLPPIGNTIQAQRSVFELELAQSLAHLMLVLSRLPGVRVVHLEGMEPVSGPKLDAKMELVAGFPYSIPYASALAKRLVEVLYQPAPRKGLITDLDDTLWLGLVGESGPDGVSWHQSDHAQTHGLYQQMLGHLAGCGVLLAICSKNEMSNVEAALARKDLFLAPSSFFPVYANWGPKSASIANVLRTWNIAQDAVVFVDDSAMEIAEVQTAFPGMTCRQFTGKDPARVWSLLTELRDLFGKPVLTEEDRIRSESIRASALLQEVGEAGNSADFLRGLNGCVTLQWRVDPGDKRPLELINKTNQFNLNGIRIAEGEWQRCLQTPQTVVAVESYADKLGPLGKVAVLVGARNGALTTVTHWVMSCRAFSRRLEYHMIDSLFRHTGSDEIEFAFQVTERNQPLQEFIEHIGARVDSAGACRISRAGFESSCDGLPHQVADII